MHPEPVGVKRLAVRCPDPHGIPQVLARLGVRCWADKAYQGAGPAFRVTYRSCWEKLSAGQKDVNRAHAKIRAVGEQAMATLKSWRLLRKLRCSTTRITDLVKAVLALELATSGVRLEKPQYPPFPR